MKVTINNIAYVFRWDYGEKPREHAGETWDARMSYCDVTKIINTVIQSSDGKKVEIEDVVAFGNAECSRHDNFCKETGRKVSLANALKKAGFTQPERKLVWDAYFNRAPGKDPRSSKNVETTKPQGVNA